MNNTVGIIREIMSARLGDKRTAAFSGSVTTITRSSSIVRMIMLPLWDDAKYMNPMALQIIVLVVRLYFDVPYTAYISRDLPISTNISATARAPMYTLQLMERFCF